MAAEPPANWDEQDDQQSTMNKFSGLNVNATEFVPNFGGGFSFTPKPSPAVPQPAAPKTPPSTPVVPRMTIEDEKKQSAPVPEPTITPMEVTNQPLTTAGERDIDDFLDEDMESKIRYCVRDLFHIEFHSEPVDETNASSKTGVTGATTTSAAPKEKKNVVVKRDIVRKKEPLNIIFCGHVDAGKSTIGGQLM